MRDDKPSKKSSKKDMIDGLLQKSNKKNLVKIF